MVWNANTAHTMSLTEYLHPSIIFLDEIVLQVNHFKFIENFFTITPYSVKITLKNLVWHSHNFLLPYITVEEYFIISITFMFNLYFLYFVADELPASIIIVYNFLTLFPFFA